MAALEDDWTDDSEEEEPPPPEPPTPDVSEESEDEVLEKPKVSAEPTISKKTGRPKKVMSQKQLDALAQGRATRDVGRAQRKTIKQENDVVKKKRRETLIVKKAVRIKKREIMEEAALELSSDESGESDVEIKQVKRAVAKKRAKKKVAAKKAEVVTPAQPAFVFY